MAKSSSALARPTIINLAPPRRRSPGRVRRAAGRAGALGKRAARRIGRAAYEERFAITGIVGTGLVGFLDGGGHLEALPTFGMDRKVELAIMAYAGGRIFKSDKLRTTGIGLAMGAAYDKGFDMARGGSSARRNG